MLSFLFGIKSWWIYIIAFILCVIIIIQYRDIQGKNADLGFCTAIKQVQDSAILEWKKEGDTQAVKVSAAQNDMIALQQNTLLESQSFLYKQVNNDCESSIKWGIAQADILSKKWNSF